ncbi:30S ribosomal protein S8 [Candidatus Micrarchaeota archaeon]|nr:30S ribosomal protein S8 [Candidatus Micrarchaeota archaeon]
MTLSDSLISIQNAELARRTTCVVRPASKLLGELLKILQKNSYLGEFELVDDGKAGFYKIQLRGAITKCRAVNPRSPTKVADIERLEKRFLPSAGEGLLIISTPGGLLTHTEARASKTGGRIMAYIY